MQLNTLKRIHKNKTSVSVGRGGKRGKTSGRGTKGQKARSGRKIRPEIRDVIMRLPKLRGRGSNSFVSRFVKPYVLKLEVLEKEFNVGETVDRKSLLEKKLAKESKIGGGIKIIGGGKVTKSLKLVGIEVSSSVKEAVEKAGGSVENAKIKDQKSK